MPQVIPFKYVLYCHYGRHEGLDFEAWKANGRAEPAEGFSGVLFLEAHLRELRRLLTAPGQEGMLIAFYSPGWVEVLKAIAAGKKRDEIEKLEALRFAEAVRQAIEALFEGDDALKPRLRVLTALDLYDIFGRLVGWEITNKLPSFLVGQTKRLLYDSPKVIEAIVRLRLLGNGLPVFRIDHDVLLHEENENQRYLGLYEAISGCLKAYSLRRDHPRIGTFILSGSYEVESISDLETNVLGPWEEYNRWNRAFATRVAPALRAKPVTTSGPRWDEYVAAAFDRRLVRRFLGLDATGSRVDPRAPGIAAIGAHPTAAVISGALLYLSVGAVLDLPPFSNLPLNVMWIDDHLRYALHREMRHLTLGKGELALLEPLLSNAKLDGAIVRKHRVDPGGNATATQLREVLGNYLPTLLWGTIFDRWIQPDKLLKFRPEDLPEERQAAWRTSRQNQQPGVFCQALQQTLEKGAFGDEDRQALEAKLWDEALERISEVVEAWTSLTVDGEESIASSWIRGTVRTWFQAADGIARGALTTEWAEAGRPKKILRRHLDPDLRETLDDLVEGALRYLEWTLTWPRIVQVVRSVPRGTLRTDLP